MAIGIFNSNNTLKTTQYTSTLPIGSVFEKATAPFWIYGTPKAGMQEGAYQPSSYAGDTTIAQYTLVGDSGRVDPITLRTTTAGYDLITKYEGFVPVPTQNRTNKWFVGYGHFLTDDELSSGIYNSIEKPTGLNLLANDLIPIEDHIRATLNCRLTQNQFNALVSFVYQIGTTMFRSGIKIVDVINDGDLEIFPNELMKWTKIGGVERAELVTRRQAEAMLFATQ